MRERYVEQVRLLVRLLPVIAAEEVFALKGDSAINLFATLDRIIDSFGRGNR